MTASSPPTVVAVALDGGRLRTRLRSSLLRPQPVHARGDRCRIGLLATTALLLGGDEVELEVDVGAGVTLELFDVAGTLAHHGRGRPARWSVQVRVADGGRLRWGGQPFVVADGAEVTRELRLDLAPGAQVLIRETLVLGRAGQAGGSVRSWTEVRRSGRPLLVEDQQLDAGGDRWRPGVLGGLRVLDSVLALGVPLPTPPPAPSARADRLDTFALPEPGATLSRWLGQEPSRSPVHGLWAASTVPLRGS